MVKRRLPMQVHPKFNLLIKKMQEDFRKKSGKNKSIRDITGEIADKLNVDINMVGLKLKMDRRKR